MVGHVDNVTGEGKIELPGEIYSEIEDGEGERWSVEVKGSTLVWWRISIRKGWDLIEGVPIERTVG